MALQIRRGTDLQRQSVVLAAGEPFFVTDYASTGVTPLWIGDGTTMGGVVAEGAQNLYDLLDVHLTNPQNNDFLRYNSSNGRWENIADLTSINMTLSGDLAVNGGDITTTSTSFNLVNSGAATLNIGGAATALGLGASTGTATINNAALKLAGNTIKNSTGTTAITLASNTTGDVGIVGALKLTGNAIQNSSGSAVITTNGTDNTAAIEGALKLKGNAIQNSAGSAVITTNSTDNTAAIEGALKLKGNAIKASDGTTAITTTATTGDVTVAGSLTLTGHTIKDSTGATAITTNGANVTIGNNLSVNGDLLVSGTTTTINTETINLADNIITLNSNATGVPSENSGIEINRGTSSKVTLRWNETTDRWETSTDGTNYIVLPNQILDTTSSPTFVNTTLSGELLTSSNVGNLFNSTATTVNIGNGATTEVNLGNINSGRVQIKSPAIVGANTTQSVFNTVATTVNAFGAATTLNLGATDSGTTYINSAALQIKNGIIRDGQGNQAIGVSLGNVYIPGELRLGKQNGTEVGTISNYAGNPVLRISDGALVSYNVKVEGKLKSTDVETETLHSGNITLNYTNSNVDSTITANRPTGQTAAVIKWNETADKWQFANGSSSYYNIVGADPTSNSVSINNLTCGGIQSGSIISSGSISADLLMSNGSITADTLTVSHNAAVGGALTVSSIYTNGVNGLQSSIKTITLNADNGNDTDDGYIKINRGTSPAYPPVSLRWNETTDRWQFTNDGVTWNNMLLSTESVTNLDGLTDVTITAPTANQYLKYNGSQWVNSTVSYALDDLSDATITTPTANQLLKYNGSQWVNSTVSYALDDLSDVVVSGSTIGQLLTYDGTNWINNNTITADSSAHTTNFVRSGAFTADTATSLKSALRLTKKFTDVSGSPSDKGGPTLLFNVQGSDGTNSTYAGLTSNRSATGAHSVSVVTSTDNFATSNEIANLTSTEATFSGAVTANGQVTGTTLNINDVIIRGTAAHTYTSTSQQVFGNVPTASYNAIKHTWRIVRGSEIQMVETMTFHNGTTAYQTIYGDAASNSNLVDFDTDISGGNMRILVTPTSATSTVVTCEYTLFKI